MEGRACGGCCGMGRWGFHGSSERGRNKEWKRALDHRELVAIGAAVAANCEPCLKYHVRKAREGSLTDDQLRAAVPVARKVKEIPARLILEAADRLLAPGERTSPEPAAKAGCCG